MILYRYQAMEKEIVVEWDDGQPPTIKETVKWIPPCNEPLPVYEELCEWSDEGKVRVFKWQNQLFLIVY